MNDDKNKRDIDKVHDLMDDISEQQQIASEISQAISNPVGFDQDVDEVKKTYFFLLLDSFLLKIPLNKKTKNLF